MHARRAASDLPSLVAFCRCGCALVALWRCGCAAVRRCARLAHAARPTSCWQMIHELNPAVSAAGTAPCILLLRRPPPSSLLGALARFPIPCCRAQTEVHLALKACARVRAGARRKQPPPHALLGRRHSGACECSQDIQAVRHAGPPLLCQDAAWRLIATPTRQRSVSCLLCLPLAYSLLLDAAAVCV